MLTRYPYGPYSKLVGELAKLKHVVSPLEMETENSILRRLCCLDKPVLDPPKMYYV